jgi:uncharacterized membrane protein YjjP (DUF1212 family)
MTLPPPPEPAASPSGATLVERLEVVLRFGAQVLRAGDPAFRVRQAMSAVARGQGLEGVSVQMGLGGIIGTARQREETATLFREVGTPGVNAARISALYELARDTSAGVEPPELAARLESIEAARPRYSVAGTGAAVGAACGAFALLSGGAGLEVLAAAVGAGVGQSVRSVFLRRGFNQYAVTAVCGLIAAAAYCLVAALARHAGFGAARHAAGFISSVLFLVPGFPLIAALLDLLHYETAAALTRLAYATTLLLSAALGLSVVVAVVGFSVEAAPPADVLSVPVRVLVRAVASLVGACGFAILFNGSWRNVWHVGALAVVGNEIRLGLRDAGMALPGATLAGALAVGLTASLARRWFREPRIALTVPGVIMMVPGLYAFQMLVLFNQGEILAGMAAAVSVGFVVGAMAIGLVAARFVSEPEWASC